MKTTEKKQNIFRTLETRFARPTRFAVVLPAPTALPFRAVQETELERLKSRLLHESLAATEDSELYASLRRAANDAAALAWTTAYPLLLFPGLFEEKALNAARYAAHQERLRRRSAA